MGEYNHKKQCGSPGNHPENLSADVKTYCPEHCIYHMFKENEVEVNQKNGSLKIKKQGRIYKVSTLENKYGPE